ncbi:MAG: FeoA family protein [Verrucomicrobiota bacterium]
MTLNQLKPGQRAEVKALHSEGMLGQRLVDLGLLPGEQVRYLRRAPLGDPIAFELRGRALSLRQPDAERVEVQIIG